MVVFLYGLACFTDKLTTTLLESMGLTILALITIPFGIVNKLGLLVHHIFHLVFDTVVLFLVFVVLPILRKLYSVFRGACTFLFSGSHAEEETKLLPGNVMQK